MGGGIHGFASAVSDESFFVPRRAAYIAPRLSSRGSALAKSGQRAGSVSLDLQHLYSACRPAPPFPWPSEPVPKKHHGAAALSVALPAIGTHLQEEPRLVPRPGKSRAPPFPRC